MRHDHLGEFLAEPRQRLQRQEDPLPIHRRKGLVEEQELRCASHRSHERLGEGETESEGESLKGSSRQLMRLQEVALFAGEEADLELGCYLGIPITASGEVRQQPAKTLAEARSGTHPYRLDRLVEQFHQQPVNIHLLTNRQRLLALPIGDFIEGAATTILVLVLADL